MLGVYNSKVADAKVEFTAASLEAEFKKCLAECNKKHSSKTDETAHDLYLELPLKATPADGPKTVKFDGDFRPRPNIPIFLESWCD